MVAEAGAQQRNLPALLTMGKPLALEGSTIILGFDFPIFKKKFDDTTGAAQLIGDTFSRLLNTNCVRSRCHQRIHRSRPRRRIPRPG